MTNLIQTIIAEIVKQECTSGYMCDVIWVKLTQTTIIHIICIELYKIHQNFRKHVQYFLSYT